MRTPLSSGVARELRGAILATARGRRAHRLHAVLLVARGLSCRRAAALLGASPRAVSYWVHRFEVENVKGLNEKRHPGRPPRLPHPARTALAAALAVPPPPQDAPRGRWTGAAMSAHLARVHGIALGARQCQRLLGRARSAKTI